VIYIHNTTLVIVLHLFELHNTSMGHARLVCTQFYFFSHTLGKAWVLQVPLSFQWISLDTPTTLFLTQVLSVEETLMNFGYTYAPSLIHQGASVITEISSANGYRNPASSNSY
jgi:hypothetical protein